MIKIIILLTKMCKHILKNNTQCKNKQEPYCGFHKKHYEEKCNVCEENNKLYPTNCCSFKICKECVIKSARATCCQCQKKLKMDKETKNIIKYIKMKDDIITDLQNQIRSLETAQNIQGQIQNIDRRLLQFFYTI